MNTDKNDNVRALTLDEIESVAGAKAAEAATDGTQPSAATSQSPASDGAVPAGGTQEFRMPRRRFLSMRI